MKLILVDPIDRNEVVLIWEIPCQIKHFSHTIQVLFVYLLVSLKGKQ